MAKATSTAKRSRQFDILQAKEATQSALSVDGRSERASELSMPGYQLKPSDRSKLSWSIKEHGEMVETLNVMLKDLKKTRFHTLSVQWACIKAGRKICPQLSKM